MNNVSLSSLTAPSPVDLTNSDPNSCTIIDLTAPAPMPSNPSFFSASSSDDTYYSSIEDNDLSLHEPTLTSHYSSSNINTNSLPFIYSQENAPINIPTADTESFQMNIAQIKSEMLCIFADRCNYLEAAYESSTKKLTENQSTPQPMFNKRETDSSICNNSNSNNNNNSSDNNNSNSKNSCFISNTPLRAKPSLSSLNGCTPTTLKTSYPISTIRLASSAKTEPTYEFKWKGTIDAELKELLVHCNQIEPVPFRDFFSDCAICSTIEKVGEATYSEVFQCYFETLDGKEKEPRVIKIVPLKYNTFSLTNDESLGNANVSDSPSLKKSRRDCSKQNTSDTKPSSVLPTDMSVDDATIELSITKVLSNYQGFIKLHKGTVVCGPYPDFLLQAWDAYAQNADGVSVCENTRPDAKAFPTNQLFIVLALENGGTDLEHFTFDCIIQSLSFAYQLTCILAGVEEKLCFEHRDLHWGNLLVKRTEIEHMIKFDAGNAGERAEVEVKSFGVECVLIDFSYSRLITEDGKELWSDLSKDAELFTGDEREDKQFAVYREMLDVMVLENTQKNIHSDASCNKSSSAYSSVNQSSQIRQISAISLDKKLRNANWNTFLPRTNVLWLIYVIDKLLNNCKYSTAKQSQCNLHISTKTRNWVYRELCKLQKILQNCQSCCQAVEQLGDKIQQFNRTAVTISQ